MGSQSSTPNVPMVITFRTETTQGEKYHVRVTKNGSTVKTSSHYKRYSQVIRSEGVPLGGKMREGRYAQGETRPSSHDPSKTKHDTTGHTPD